MYKLEIDRAKKLVKFELNGFVKLEEAIAFQAELEKALKQFKPKEALILGNLVGFKPASPEVLPIMGKLQAESAEYGKKLATVLDSVLVQAQAKRVGEQSSVNDVIKRFKTEEEALKYLVG
ncbi:MAG: hypothetical protein N3B21_00520 [Clostridia bacterium]|nr:hypothetical protein [Clostridia bacterium]